MSGSSEGDSNRVRCPGCGTQTPKDETWLFGTCPDCAARHQEAQKRMDALPIPTHVHVRGGR